MLTERYDHEVSLEQQAAAAYPVTLPRVARRARTSSFRDRGRQPGDPAGPAEKPMVSTQPAA